MRQDVEEASKSVGREDDPTFGFDGRVQSGVVLEGRRGTLHESEFRVHEGIDQSRHEPRLVAKVVADGGLVDTCRGSHPPQGHLAVASLDE